MGSKQKQKQNFCASRESARITTGNLNTRLFLLNKIICGLIIAGGCYFVMSINDLSVKGFILEELKTQKAAIYRDNNNLELRIAELESSDNLRRRAESLKMVKAEKLEYLTITSSAMAKN